MHINAFFVVLFCLLPALGGHQTLPWIASKDGEWASQIILNNPSSQEANLQLQAIRPDGVVHEANLSLSPHQQQVHDPQELFPTLGSGSGFSLFISGDNSNLSAAARVASSQAASGFSPAMASAVRNEHASNRLLFPAMPNDGFSAIAITNITESSQQVQITAFTQTGQYGEPVTVTIEAKRPYATVLSQLFPDLSDNAYLIISGEDALIGANFSFNSELEPAMINAEPAPADDTAIVSPLLTSVSTINAVSDGYTDATAGVYSKVPTKMECPEVTTDIVLTDPNQFVTATVDYGTGCTTPTGVYRSGSITLSLAREGNISTGALLSGTLNLNNLTTQYQGSDATVNGDILVSGSTLSANFAASGNLSISGTSQLYETTGDAEFGFNLQGQVSENSVSLYGDVAVLVDANYNYDVNATIASQTPLVYTLDCPWPVSGLVAFTTVHSNRTYTGTLDFDTGACYSATLIINGVTKTIDLSEYY